MPRSVGNPGTSIPSVPAQWAAVIVIICAAIAAAGTHAADAPATTGTVTIPQPSPTGGSGGTLPPAAVQTPTLAPAATGLSSGSHCVARGAYPDPGCTPGVILTSDTATVCVRGYTRTVRNVSVQTKDGVYAEYGIASHSPGQFEIDHFIPLELGGANDLANLWPEPADPTPGFHEKDAVENWLHDQVCAGHMTLADAQASIRTDWLAVWNQMSTSNGQG